MIKKLSVPLLLFSHLPIVSKHTELINLSAEVNIQKKQPGEQFEILLEITLYKEQMLQHYCLYAYV